MPKISPFDYLSDVLRAPDYARVVTEILNGTLAWGAGKTAPITPADVPQIHPRVAKPPAEQAQRSRESAEIFTPAWVCKAQIDLVEGAAGGALPLPAPFLEVACGEAPYLTTRYDAVSGKFLAPGERVGVLDRKLAQLPGPEAAWEAGALRALQVCYGYELRGDSLALARANLVASLGEHYTSRFAAPAPARLLIAAAQIAGRNLWQMAGPPQQGRVYDWERGQEVGLGARGFTGVLGNPPYQESVSAAPANAALGRQLFPDFAIAALSLGARYVSLIMPSRWFAGFAQDKSFLRLREFLAQNGRLRTLVHYPDAREVFTGVEIKGGVSYFLHDATYAGHVDFVTVRAGEQTRESRPLFEPGLDVVLADGRSVGIVRKVVFREGFRALTEITTGRNAFGIIGKPSVVAGLRRPGGEGVLVCRGGERVAIDPREVQKSREVLGAYKVFISKSAGAPERDRRVIARPIVAGPGEACTDSFFPIGCFETRGEAERLAKYLETKFVRFLVAALKTSHNVTQIVYRFVPLLNFKDNSLIDWDKEVDQIDAKLFAVYGLSPAEIAYIERAVAPQVTV